MRFEWDAVKAATNFGKHGVSFAEAVEVFDDPNALEAYDPEHSTSVRRYVMIGLSGRRLLSVVFTEPEPDMVRIISARKATKKERDVYEQEAIS